MAKRKGAVLAPPFVADWCPRPGATLTLGSALPAAADSNGTAATLTITGGALGITVDTTAVNLGAQASTTGSATISGNLGRVQVTDQRGAPTGSSWVATVTATPFTSRTGTAISPARISYTAARSVDTDPHHRHRPRARQQPHQPAAHHRSGHRTNITGPNTATWPPHPHHPAPPP